MIIPDRSIHDCFYVATAINSGYASYPTLDEATACIRRYEVKSKTDRDVNRDYKKIIGVVRTYAEGREIILSKENAIVPQPFINTRETDNTAENTAALSA
jgi:hypothetical protein